MVLLTFRMYYFKSGNCRLEKRDMFNFMLRCLDCES